MQTSRVPPLLQVSFHFKRQENPFRSRPMGRNKRPIEIMSFAEQIGELLLNPALYGEDMGECYARAIAQRRGENELALEANPNHAIGALVAAGLVKPVQGLVTDTFAFGKRENLVRVTQLALLTGEGIGREERIFVEDPLFERNLMSALNDLLARYGGNRLRASAFHFDATCRPPVTIRRPGRLRPDFVRAHPAAMR